jgi:hypothetical protein
MTSKDRFSVVLGISLALFSGMATLSVQDVAASDVQPAPARTVFLHRCGGPQMSTPGISCNGFAGTEILEDPSIFVVGFENNDTLAEKHIYQAVAVYDFSDEKPGPDEIVTSATIRYGEYSTTRRSPDGDSEYGILPSCNTRLGVATAPFDGNPAKLITTTPAMTAGHAVATTGDSGSWDVTPQITAWLNEGKTQGTLVFQGDDESTDVKAQAMCLSYIGELILTIELAPKP